MSDITRLRDTVNRFSAFILALPVDTLADQSADGASGEWGPREVLAHLVYHHELYVALVEAWVAGTAAEPPAGTFRELNAQAVAANAEVPAPALVARLQEANRRLEQLYLAHNPHAIVVEIKAGAKPRTLAALVPEVEAHIRNHLRKLQRQEWHVQDRFLQLSTDWNDPKRVVEQGYDQVAHEYAQLEAGADWPRMRWLRRLLNELKPGSSILDLGCGSGDPADIEIAREHSVTGVDISQAQIALARRNVPAGTFIHGDAGTVEFPTASFDAVVSFYALEHIPRTEHALLFRRIHRWLRSGGFLLMSHEADEAEGLISQWLGVPMFFSCFDLETVKGLITSAGFEIIETKIEIQVEGGIEIPYHWLLARKP